MLLFSPVKRLIIPSSPDAEASWGSLRILLWLLWLGGSGKVELSDETTDSGKVTDLLSRPPPLNFGSGRRWAAISGGRMD